MKYNKQSLIYIINKKLIKCIDNKMFYNKNQITNKYENDKFKMRLGIFNDNVMYIMICWNK